MTTDRPRLALWLKYRWRLLRWVPILGGFIWRWADRRVDAWHTANGRGNE